MKRTVGSTILVWASLLLPIGGCAAPGQVSWHDKVYFVVHGVSEIEQSGAARLREDLLLAMLGQPDFKDSVRGFSKLLVVGSRDSIDYRQAIMTRIWQGYRRQTGGKAALLTWSGDSGFLQSQVWLYDERRHFDRPLPHGFGYQAYYFLLDKEHVVSAGGILDTGRRLSQP